MPKQTPSEKILIIAEKLTTEDLLKVFADLKEYTHKKVIAEQERFSDKASELQSIAERINGNQIHQSL